MSNTWPVELDGCFSYKNKEGKSMWCPNFIPQSLCGTCFIIGKIQSILDNEEIKCLDMGKSGCCCCFLTVPLAVTQYTVLGAIGFACISSKFRKTVVEKYNIDDTKTAKCCCGISLAPALIGFAYPCSLFQVYMFLLENKDNKIMNEKV